MEKSSELETAEDEDAGLRDEGGYKGRRVNPCYRGNAIFY